MGYHRSLSYFLQKSLALSTRFALGMAVSAVLSACPSETADVDAGMTSLEDAGVIVLDAGGILKEDAGSGVEEDAGNGAATDAGQTVEADAGNTPLVDAGSSVSCERVSPCAGISPSGSVVFTPNATAPTVVVGGELLTIGVTTRAETEAALGNLIADGTNPYRGFACAARLDLRFVDDVVGGDFEGNASANDVLARVLTMNDSSATSSRGAQIDSALAAATANFTQTASYSVGEATLSFDAAMGFGVRSRSGAVEQMIAFLPQDADRWGMTLNLQGLSLSDGNLTFSAGERPMSEASAVFGAAYDAEAKLTVSGLAVTTRIYAATGIRIADVCLGNFCRNAETIILSPPFAGTDSNGLGIGSTQAEFEAVMGTPISYSGDAPSQDDQLHVYGAGADVGILYVKDVDCEKHVAAIVLGFKEVPN